MFQSLLQIRAEEIQRERLAEAAERRLARQATVGRAGWMSRIAGALGRPEAMRRQASDASASATSRTPDSISDVVAVPYPKTSPRGARAGSL